MPSPTISASCVTELVIVYFSCLWEVYLLCTSKHYWFVVFNQPHPWGVLFVSIFYLTRNRVSAWYRHQATGWKGCIPLRGAGTASQLCTRDRGWDGVSSSWFKALPTLAIVDIWVGTTFQVKKWFQKNKKTADWTGVGFREVAGKSNHCAWFSFSYPHSCLGWITVSCQS